MRRSARALVAAVAAGVLVAALGPMPAGAATPHVRRVLVVTVPALRWADVEAHAGPVLDRLVRRGAVAEMSVRSLGPTTSPVDGYATIGAGNRAGAADRVGRLALDAGAPFEGGTAREAFDRRCGCAAADAEVVHLDMPVVRAYNDGLLYGAVPGALGRALEATGRRAGVVANSATSLHDLAGHGEAALAAADTRGRVAVGSVADGLLQRDRHAPFGVRMDADAVVTATTRAWDRADVVFVEASDLARVDAQRPLASQAGTDAALTVALSDFDSLLGRLLEQVDLQRDLVLVVAPTSPSSSAAAQLGVAVLAGKGIAPGLARSATTRRSGFVTLPDVAPTILDAFGIDAPTEMNGTAITSAGGHAPDAGTIAHLADVNRLTVFRDRVTGPASVLFVVFQVLVYFAAMAALGLARVRPARRWLAALSLVTLAQPVLVFLSALIRYDRLGGSPGYVALLFLGGAALALGALVATGGWRWWRMPLSPMAPLGLVALTLVVLVVDGVTGARLQLDSVFGYSPTVAGRFSGFGNLAFGLLAAAAMVVATGVWRLGASRGRRGPTAAVVAGLLFVVAVDAAPPWGGDVGGLLSLLPAVIVVGLLLAGRKVDLRKIIGIGVVTVATSVVLALLDLARPPSSRTHLGRLAARLGDRDGGFVTILQRKLQANANILTSSVWTWIIPPAVVLLVFLLWRPGRRLQGLEARTPGLRAGLIGAAIAGGLGFALNDSGVAVPAVMLAVVLPYVTYLALAASLDEA